MKPLCMCSRDCFMLTDRAVTMWTTSRRNRMDRFMHAVAYPHLVSDPSLALGKVARVNIALSTTEERHTRSQLCSQAPTSQRRVTAFTPTALVVAPLALHNSSRFYSSNATSARSQPTEAFRTSRLLAYMHTRLTVGNYRHMTLLVTRYACSLRFIILHHSSSHGSSSL